MVKKLIPALTLLFSVKSAFAQVGGSKTFSFLNIPAPVPRSVALGGNSIGIKDDDFGNAMQSPALLSNQTSNAFFLSTVRYIGDTKHQYFSYGKSFDKIGHFAAGIQTVAYGLIDQRDEYGNSMGTIKANDYCFNIAYARDKDSLFTYGVNLKTIYSQFGSYKSVGNAVDLGLTYSKPSKQFTISALFKNYGYQWKSYTGGPKEKLPLDFQIGTSYKVPKAPFRLVATYDYLNRWDLTYIDPNNPPPTEDPFTHEPLKKHPGKIWLDKFGRHMIPAIEVLLTKNFNLRVGYNYRRREELILTDKQGLAGFSFGVGLRVTCFQISWAYAQYTPGFGTNFFSISTKRSEYIDFKKRMKERKEARAKETSQ
ncbi:MAG TPA: type IX secretion system protein PorQ [Bacteroidia bacterium]|jgi:hypothetical protein|nr:type IX secretion system protein PorQ [Bacteroidia bacterium]